MTHIFPVCAYTINKANSTLEELEHTSVAVKQGLLLGKTVKYFFEYREKQTYLQH